MDRTNAERQRRYIAKLKAAAAAHPGVTNSGTAGEKASVTNGDAVGTNLKDTQAVQTQAAQTAQLQTAVQPPPRQRVIVVKKPGVAPQGANEISFEVWQQLGCDTARLREFLRQRDSVAAS
jgi:preprotein translocase subunit SecD